MVIIIICMYAQVAATQTDRVKCDNKTVRAVGGDIGLLCIGIN